MILAIGLILTLAGIAPAADRKVVLISIDGLKGTTLGSIVARKLKTPNLNQFVEKGAVSEGLQGVFPTVTYPSHTTLVTGRSPASHGILGNTLFDPERKMNGAWYYYAEQIHGTTLWDAARAHGLTTAGVSWPVTVGARMDFNIPEYRFPRTIEDRMALRAVSTPGLLAEFERVHGELPIVRQTDLLRARMAAFLFKTRKPDLLLVHLMDMDHEEHAHGPDSVEALKTLEENDQHIGLIRTAVAAAGLERQTSFVIVSDHGFWPVEKTFHPHAVLQSIGLGVPEQKPAEWRVAVHGNGGSFALNARDPNDQEAIERATRTFQRLHAEGTYGIGKVALRKELDAARSYPGSFLAVSMASGYTVGYGSTGPWVTASGNTKGMHGYWPGPVELDAAFVAYGDGIPARGLARSKMVDVAPTVAAMLSFALPDAEGRNLLAAPPASRYPAHWWNPIAKEGAPSWEIMPQEAGPGEVILSKRHELGLLSNFAATPFTYRGKRYASLEGFWQMMLYPEASGDPRATFAGLEWKYTRDQVAQMTAFEAKNAGTLAERNMQKMGIGWVSFEGRQFDYRLSTAGEHYRLIVEATREKVRQNPEVRRVLMATGDLILRPDHHTEPNVPEAWRYYEILTMIRGELRQR
ncbi:MAG: alkaline phosphatase family protein [Acidobacteria bacterium]|nr:alkaline phosphatase family protein [Acidobacteriota bacterium]